MLTTREMFCLQGLPECLITIAETAGVSERQLCQMIGHAMSLKVDNFKPVASSLGLSETYFALAEALASRTPSLG